MHNEYEMFIFPIPPYQNACYRCENAENQTWSEFFLWMKVSEAVCRDLNIFCKAALQWLYCEKLYTNKLELNRIELMHCILY